MRRPACVVFLGPPGVGKGTQAVQAAERLGVPAISTGDLFRAARAQASPLGARVKGYMDRGELVPDDVVIEVVRDRIARPDSAGGFLLDGFPRTVPQAEALDAMLADQGRCLSVVVSLDAPEAVILERLGGRRTCGSCHASYHVANHPPRRPDVCDACGGALIVRPDDRPDAIRTRLSVYRRQTQPLVEFYRAAGTLRGLDGAGGVEEVAARVAGALA